MIADEQLNQKLSGLATTQQLESLRNDMERKFAVVDTKLDALTAAINKIHTMQVVLVGGILGMTGLGVLASIVKYLFFTQ